MSTTELIPAREMLIESQRDMEAQRYLPVMSMGMAIQRRESIIEAVQKLMHVDIDYGMIPGTKKNTLYQPGADKLNNLFGLIPRYETIEESEDWTGENHGGEPHFYYKVRCSLWRNEFLMGEGVGSCNSWEEKYRFRKSERVCPDCGKANIRKSKADPARNKPAGWYCWAKTGGCGAQFAEDDAAIIDQQVGNVPNPNVFDLVNTILKMANKRAKIAATLNALSAHEFFTQDVEDMPRHLVADDDSFESQPRQQQTQQPRQQPQRPQPTQPQQSSDHITREQAEQFKALAERNGKTQQDVAGKMREMNYSRLSEVTQEDYKKLIYWAAPAPTENGPQRQGPRRPQPAAEPQPAMFESPNEYPE